MHSYITKISHCLGSHTSVVGDLSNVLEVVLSQGRGEGYDHWQTGP
jgi:hypothetical protein